jgi:hypothetical protein
LEIIPEFAVPIVNRGTEDDRGSDKTIVIGMDEEIINIHDDDDDDDDDDGNSNNNNNNVSNKLTVTPNVVTFLCIRNILNWNFCREIDYYDGQCSGSLSVSRPVPAFCLSFKIE